MFPSLALHGTMHRRASVHTIAIEQTEEKMYLDYVKTVKKAALQEKITVTEKEFAYDPKGRKVSEIIRKVEPPDAQTAERMLERLFPERFIRPKHYVLDGDWKAAVSERGGDPEVLEERLYDHFDKEILFDNWKTETDPELKAELANRAKAWTEWENETDPELKAELEKRLLRTWKKKN